MSVIREIKTNQIIAIILAFSVPVFLFIMEWLIYRVSSDAIVSDALVVVLVPLLLILIKYSGSKIWLGWIAMPVVVLNALMQSFIGLYPILSQQKSSPPDLTGMIFCGMHLYCVLIQIACIVVFIFRWYMYYSKKSTSGDSRSD